MHFNAYFIILKTSKNMTDNNFIYCCLIEMSANIFSDISNSI